MKPSNNIPEELLLEERMKGARISVYFRWAFISILAVLLAAQFYLGYTEVSKQALLLLFLYIIANTGFHIALFKKYDPRFLKFVSATFDVAVICYHIYGMAQMSDYTAVSAAATIFFFPVFFLIYTFRLDKWMLIYLIFISVLGYNMIYFASYFEQTQFYNEYLSLSPTSQIFKSFYISFIGLLCVYFQISVFKFLDKQLLHTKEKAKLDTEFKVEQEKNRFAKQLIDKEKALNQELADEIMKKDKLARQLEDSKEKLESIISNLLGFTYRCLPDEKWTMLFVSEQIEDVCGYKAQDLVADNNLTYNKIIYPDDIEFVNNQISKAISDRTQFDMEYRIRHRNGNVVWVHDAGKGVYDEGGNILYIDGIITDITVKKQAELELEETRGLVNNIISNLVGAVSRCLNDEKFTTKFYSDKIFDITGYYATDFIDNKNMSFTDIVHPDDLEYLEKYVGECVKDKKPYSIEFRIIHKSGNIVWVNENGQPVTDKEGNVIYLDGITTDITEKKIAEQALYEAKQELEMLNKDLEQKIEERTAQLTKANTQLLKMQKENLQSQFEVLKQQVNPHFLFNSLNVLTSLIKVDADLAEKFTERLSKVYRYVLENKNKDIVTLKTEMDFLKAYVFLIDIRFADKVFVNIGFDDNNPDMYVVPLALQLLIENAIKHNSFSKKSPLIIDLFVDVDYLYVVNNLQNRDIQRKSTGIGLDNINKRYKLLCDKEPVFEMTDKQFVAKIPLIKN